MKRQEYKLLVESWNSFLVEEEKRLLNEELLIESLLLNESFMSWLRSSKGSQRAVNALMALAIMANTAEDSFAKGKANHVLEKPGVTKMLDQAGVTPEEVQQAAQEITEKDFDIDQYKENKEQLERELPSVLKNEENLNRDNVNANIMKLKGKSDVKALFIDIKVVVEKALENEKFGLYEPGDIPDDMEKRDFIDKILDSARDNTSFDSSSKSDVILMSMARLYAASKYYEEYKAEIANMDDEESFSKEYSSVEGDDNLDISGVKAAAQGDSNTAYNMAAADAEAQQKQEKSIFSGESVTISGDLNALVLASFMSEEFSSHIGIGSVSSAGDLEKAINDQINSINYKDSFVFLKGKKLSPSALKEKFSSRIKNLAKTMKYFFARNRAFDDNSGMLDGEDSDANVISGDQSVDTMLDDEISQNDDNAALIGHALKLARDGAAFSRSGEIESKRIGLTREKN